MTATLPAPNPVNWNSATPDPLTAAQRLAQSLANITRVPTHVVSDHGRYLVQDEADIDCYGGRAAIVATFAPAPPDDAPGDDCPDHGPYEEGDDCPKCSACHTNDYPPSSSAAFCIACANARRFGFNSRFSAARHAVTLQSQAIEAKLVTCGYCKGMHHIQRCPTLRSALRADAWVGADLGRGLCQLRWRNHADFVQLLERATPARLVQYAESYIGFIRANRPESTLTTHEVLSRWLPLIGDRGPAVRQQAA